MQSSIDILLVENALLKSHLGKAQKRIQELEEKLSLNSKNSSRPPSSDFKKQKKSEGSKGGAKKGHKAHIRKEIEKSDQTIQCSTQTCPFCGNSEIKKLPKISTHQQIELFERGLKVIDYQRPLYQCQNCRKKKFSPLPQGVSGSNFGFRLSSAIALMTGSFHLSKREVPALMKQLFGIHISSGSISNIEKKISRALESTYREIGRKAQKSSLCRYVDETSWRDRGMNYVLWLHTSRELAYYHINRFRNRTACDCLLGGKLGLATVTDRYSVYNYLTGPHQYCLSHLLRDFKRISERSGLQAVIGQGLVEEIKEVFDLWKRYSKKELSRKSLKQRVYYRRQKIEQWLWDGWRSKVPKLQRFCQRLLEDYDCLWTFLRIKDMDPHNNLAERDLRSLVLWRKKSFGTKSEAGRSFVERISSVCKTVIKQGKNVLNFISNCLQSKILGKSIPLLFI